MYPTDFEADTSHLTLAEDGAYNRLLRLMWMTPACSLPDDDKWIMRRMRVSQEEFESVVLVVIGEFFDRSKGRVSNARLAKEFIKTHEAHSKRVLAGSKGGKAKSLKSKDSTSSKAKAMPKQPEPEPEPYKKDTNVSSVQSQDFQDFWDAFPHRDGKKTKRPDAEKAFIKALKGGATIQAIADGVAAMRRDPDVGRGYGRGPVPWLNQQGWTDEIPTTPQLTAINGGQYDQSSHNSKSAQRDQALADEILAAARAR